MSCRTARPSADASREGRRPTLTWSREIPIEGDPEDITAVVDAYAAWLATDEEFGVIGAGPSQ